MAAIAASNVTYTEAPYPTKHLSGEPPRFKNNVTVSFGNGILTYPTNGVPLSASMLGFPNGIIESCVVMDQSGKGTDKNDWTFDSVHNTLRGYLPSTGVEFSGAVAATSLVLEVEGY